MVATTTTATAKRKLASVSALKKKVRDRERLLKRQALPANVASEQERALQAYKHELKTAAQLRKEHKYAKKYHMVRFFERKKSMRLAKKLRKASEAAPDDVELRAKVFDAEVCVNYTLHYPRDEKYISLFKDPGDSTKVREKRDEIKAKIAAAMKEGTLERGIALEKQERSMPQDGGEKSEKKEKKPKKGKKEEKQDGEKKDWKRERDESQEEERREREEKQRKTEEKMVHPSRRQQEPQGMNRRERRAAKAAAKKAEMEAQTKAERIEDDDFFDL